MINVPFSNFISYQSTYHHLIYFVLFVYIFIVFLPCLEYELFEDRNSVYYNHHIMPLT